MSEKAIIPIEQKQIEFHDDMVTAVLTPDDKIYIPVKPLCELIGIDWDGQRQRINRDEILSEVAISTVITTAQIDGKKGQRHTQNMIALPLEYLNGWLFGISANRVKPEIKDALLRYRRDCYRVLFEAFGKNSIAVRPDDDLMQSDSPQGAAYRTGLAIAKLAREQYYMGVQVDDHERRIGLLEARLGEPDRFVSETQAQQIATAVKMIALKLGENSKKNEFGGVYGALYTRFGITSYKRIPAATFDEAIEWLNKWHESLTNDLS